MAVKKPVVSTPPLTSQMKGSKTLGEQAKMHKLGNERRRMSNMDYNSHSHCLVDTNIFRKFHPITTNIETYFHLNEAY